MPGKKGAPELEQLLEIARRHEQHKDRYSALSQQQTWLRCIDHILNPDKSKASQLQGPELADAVEQELWDFLEHIRVEAQRNPTLEHFVDHVRRWTKSHGKGLFACFRETRLPRTNNFLERYFRTLKGRHRRITGRQSWNTFVLRLGAMAAFLDLKDRSSNGLPPLCDALYRKFRDCRQRWRDAQAPALQRARYRHDPKAFLQAMVEQWGH